MADDKQRREDVLNLLRMTVDVINRARYMQLRHVLQGVDGYAEVVFPIIQNRICLQANYRIRNGTRIARAVFKALEKKSIELATEHLRVLYERRDEIEKTDDIEALDRINVEIVNMKRMIDDYDDYFGDDACKMLQRCLSTRLKLKLEAYAREPQIIKRLQESMDCEDEPPKKKSA